MTDEERDARIERRWRWITFMEMFVLLTASSTIAGDVVYCDTRFDRALTTFTSVFLFGAFVVWATSRYRS